MKILVTGAGGFVGRNLVENLKALRDGKNRTRPGLAVSEIMEYDLENTPDSVFCSHGAGYTVKWYDVREKMHVEDEGVRLTEWREADAAFFGAL